MKFLIVKMSSLGDIIHSFPVIDQIKSYDENATIDWVVEQECVGLVSGHPLVNEAIIANTRAWRSKPFSKSTFQSVKKFVRTLREKEYDFVIDLQGNTKSLLPTLTAKAKTKIGFGMKTVREKLNLLGTNRRFDPPKTVNVREENLFLVEKAFGKKWESQNTLKLKLTPKEESELAKLSYLIKEKPGEKILVSIGSNWPNKQISPETLQEFMRSYAGQKEAHFFLIFGGETEKEALSKVHEAFPHLTSFLPKLSLPLLQRLMFEVDLVIAMDSLVLHLAGTTPVPSYGLFGPSLGEKFNPIGKQKRFYQGSCPYGILFDRRCPKLRSCPTGACMKELKGQELAKHFFQS